MLAGSGVVLGIMAVGLGPCVAGRWLPDASSTTSRARLLTRDLAPGDEVTVSVTADVLTTVRADTAYLDGRELEPLGAGSWRLPDATLGAHSLDVQALVGDGADRQREDLGIPIELRSRADAADARLHHRALAVLAWIVACVFAFACVRWLPRKAKAAPRAFGSLAARERRVLWRVIAKAGVAALIGIVLIGALVFVRPVLGTLTDPCVLDERILLAMWACAPMIGVAIALRRRHRALRWTSVRLRAVLGTPRAGSYREAAQVLPAMLSRDAAACSADEVRAACARAGYGVRAVGHRIEVTAAGARWRLRGTRRAPWRPEDLELLTFDGADASPLVRALVAIYGALEYTAVDAQPVIEDVPSRVPGAPS